MPSALYWHNLEKCEQRNREMKRAAGEVGDGWKVFWEIMGLIALCPIILLVCGGINAYDKIVLSKDEFVCARYVEPKNILGDDKQIKVDCDTWQRRR